MFYLMDHYLLWTFIQKMFLYKVNMEGNASPTLSDIFSNKVFCMDKVKEYQGILCNSGPM